MSSAMLSRIDKDTNQTPTIFTFDKCRHETKSYVGLLYVDGN